MAGDENVGSLEEQALKRKERLRALREKKNKGEETTSDRETLPKPVFRSYKPEDEGLQESVLPPAAPESIEEQIKDRTTVQADDLVKDIDLSSLAPRKPDWDLKRDVAKKLEKLDKRTKRAIAELIRERLARGTETDLAQAVNTASGPQTVDSDED
ncbi:coiled-coil domain-containing protein 12-like [Ornithodoros turicata]|uniref:coiled-coil domain-containing protein 12-like n=1 Tax=Ornithodoros turicata TaxID=34597 RepID=UPI003138B76E